MDDIGGRGGRARAALCALVAVVLVVVAGGVAWAQDSPYGPTSTSAPTTVPTASCDATPTSGPPGTDGTADVSGAVPGDEVSIVIGGETAGTATATATDVTVAFTVPGLAPGTYSFAAVMTTDTVPCGSGEFEVTEGGAEVLGAQVERAGSGTGSGSAARETAVAGSRTERSRLALTGVALGSLAVAGVALVLAGRQIVRAGRGRDGAAAG